MSDFVGYVAALLFVLALIGVCAWLLRRFVLGDGATNSGGLLRGNGKRLKIVASASVDPRRRLLLIRRDDVEHLVLVGGANDLVIETGIDPTDMPEESAEPQSRSLVGRFVSTRGGA